MTIRSFGIFCLIAILLAIGLCVRVTGLNDVDLYSDEALSAEISESLIKYGQLNYFKYSKFASKSWFKYNICIAYPPLYFCVQAPFFLLNKDIWGWNIVPRLPALLSGLIIMAMLYIISGNIFDKKITGLIAVIFTVFNGYQIGMSRLALPLPVLTAFLCATFWFLIRALKTESKKYWILTSLFLSFSFYIHQTALLFGFIYIPAFIICLRENKKKNAWYLTLCFFAAFAVSLVWVLFFMRGLLAYHIFRQATENYDFFEKISLIFRHYNSMLPYLALKIAFVIGFIKMIYDAVKRNRHSGILLVAWAMIPLTFMLTKTMWVNQRHLFFAFPPVMVIAAYGIYVFITYLFKRTYIRSLPANKAFYIPVIILFSIIMSLFQVKGFNFHTGISAAEFGSPNIASRACGYIKKHYNEEGIIAPIGQVEAYYLEKFVHDKNKGDAVEICFKLISEHPAWVFMGDNFWQNGKLDEFDKYVQENGRLIMHSKPVAGFTDKENKSGYALYYIEKQNAKVVKR